MHKDFRTDGTSLIKYLGSEENVKIPEGITKINDSAFWGSDNIKSVALPSTIEEIEIGCYGRRDIYKTLPEWSFDTISRLSPSIAKLIRRSWLSQMTPRSWAVLYLTQNTQAFNELFKAHMADKPNEYFAEMLNLLGGCGKAMAYSRVAGYAAEYNREIKRELIIQINALVKIKRNAKSAAEILEFIADPKVVDKDSPYAWLYERFDEPKLKKRYRDYGGKISALNNVLSADGSENAPQIAVLAAVVPYLEFFDKERRSNYTDTKVKILPDSDKAACMLSRSSLMDFINKNTNINSNTKWLYPYCRYASEKEIEDLISNKKNTPQESDKLFYECVLPSNALVLSDYYAPRLELNEGKKYIRRIGAYAKIRGTTEDVVLTDIGLGESGKITYNLGGDKITAFLTDDFKLKLYSEKTGAAVGSLPKKGMEYPLYKKAKADFRKKCGQSEQAVKIRTDRLFKDFLSGTERDFEEWKHTNFKTAINKIFSQRLVWEQNRKTFIVKDGRLINSCEAEYIPSDAPVKLAHPMEMSPEDISAWRRYFSDNNIEQPFVQIEEPVIDLKSVNDKRYQGIKLTLTDLEDQSAHGIETRVYGGPFLGLRDCDIKYTKHFGFGGYMRSMSNKVEIYKFTPVKYNRQVNHIVSVLDRLMTIEQIKKDDMSAAELLDYANAAQLEEYTQIAIENGAKNLTAKLLELKKERFPEHSSLDDFTLGEW